VVEAPSKTAAPFEAEAAVKEEYLGEAEAPPDEEVSNEMSTEASIKMISVEAATTDEAFAKVTAKPNSTVDEPTVPEEASDAEKQTPVAEAIIIESSVDEPALIAPIEESLVDGKSAEGAPVGSEAPIKEVTPLEGESTTIEAITSEAPVEEPSVGETSPDDIPTVEISAEAPPTGVASIKETPVEVPAVEQVVVVVEAPSKTAAPFEAEAAVKEKYLGEAEAPPDEEVCNEMSTEASIKTTLVEAAPTDEAFAKVTAKPDSTVDEPTIPEEVSHTKERIKEAPVAEAIAIESSLEEPAFEILAAPFAEVPLKEHSMEESPQLLNTEALPAAEYSIEKPAAEEPGNLLRELPLGRRPPSRK
jgi:hypothetical protein